MICLMLVFPVLASADIYRYVDKDGVVTYTEQLPYGVTGEKIQTVTGGPTQTVRSSASGGASAVPQGAANERVALSPEQQAMLDQLKRAEDARKMELAKIREANCTRSRDVLARLSSQGRIRVRDEAGEERAMPEDERERRIQEAQVGVATNCDTP